MRKIRYSVFETNSSSTHSITFVNEDKLNQFIKGESFFNTYYNDASRNKDNLPEFPTHKQVRDYILNNVLKYNKLIDDSHADKDELQDTAWVLRWLALNVPGSNMENMVNDYVSIRNDDGTWSTRKGYQKIEDVNYFVDTVMKHIGGPSGQFISFDKATFVHISRGHISNDDDFFNDKATEEVECAIRERNIKDDKLIGLLIQYYNG